MFSFHKLVSVLLVTILSKKVSLPDTFNFWRLKSHLVGGNVEHCKPIVHLRGRSYFVRVGGQLAFSLIRVTSVAQKRPVERPIITDLNGLRKLLTSLTSKFTRGIMGLSILVPGNFSRPTSFPHSAWERGGWHMSQIVSARRHRK